MLCFAPVYALDDSSWQTVQPNISVRLAIRNKLAATNYSAQFVVVAGGKKHTCVKQVAGSSWGGAVFLNDFDCADGTYKWQAFVKGKPVLSGFFTYSHTGKPNHF